jgi:hypothetical protein
MSYELRNKKRGGGTKGLGVRGLEQGTGNKEIETRKEE